MLYPTELRAHAVRLGCPKSARRSRLATKAAGVRCRSPNCLHDAVVTTAPHTAGNFDLAADYVKFDAGHQPVTEWLDRQSAALDKIAR